MGTYFTRYYFVSVYVSEKVYKYSETYILLYLQLYICCMCQITAWVAFVFKNILIMVGTQMSSDRENKCLSLHRSRSNNWILHHLLAPPPWHTHKIMIFMLPGAFPGGDVDGHAALCGWQLSTSILLCTNLGGVVRRGMKGSLRVWGGSSWTKCVHQNMYAYKRGMPDHCAPFWSKALHRSSKQPYFCTLPVKSIKEKCYTRLLPFYLAVPSAE